MSVDLKLRQSQGPMFLSIKTVITHKQQCRTMKSKITFWPVRSSPGSKILHFITNILSTEFFLLAHSRCKHTHMHTSVVYQHALFHICLHLNPRSFPFCWLLCPRSAISPDPSHVYLYPLVTLPACPTNPPLAFFDQKQLVYVLIVVGNELCDITVILNVNTV